MGKRREPKRCQIQGPGRCQKQEAADSPKKASMWRSVGNVRVRSRALPLPDPKADTVGEAQPRTSPQPLGLRCRDLFTVCLGPHLGSALRCFYRALGFELRSFNFPNPLHLYFRYFLSFKSAFGEILLYRQYIWTENNNIFHFTVLYT